MQQRKPIQDHVRNKLHSILADDIRIYDRERSLEAWKVGTSQGILTAIGKDSSS
jgi:hypothetical protein